MLKYHYLVNCTGLIKNLYSLQISFILWQVDIETQDIYRELRLHLRFSAFADTVMRLLKRCCPFSGNLIEL